MFLVRDPGFFWGKRFSPTSLFFSERMRMHAYAEGVYQGGDVDVFESVGDAPVAQHPANRKFGGA